MGGLWKDTPIHVIDFEGSRATGVLEYGIVTLLNGEVKEVKTRLCSPIGRIPEADTRIHGITTCDTLGALPFNAETDLFMDLRSTGPLCAHNASFENHLLKALWPYPRKTPDFLESGRDVADWGPWIDTYRLYQLVFPSLGDHGLGALLDTFGLADKLDILSKEHCPSTRRQYHCALYDALGSALLLSYLGGLPGYEHMTLDWLIIQSGKNEENRAQTELF